MMMMMMAAVDVITATQSFSTCLLAPRFTIATIMFSEAMNGNS